MEEDVDVVKGPRAALNAKDKHLRDLMNQVLRMERYLGNMDPSTKEELDNLRENMTQVFEKEKMKEISVQTSKKHMDHMFKHRKQLITARKVLESLCPDIVDVSEAKATQKNMRQIFATRFKKTRAKDGNKKYCLKKVDIFIVDVLDIARGIKSYATYVWRTIFRDERFDDLNFSEKMDLVRMYTLGSHVFYKKLKVVDYVLGILRAALVPSAAIQGEYYTTFKKNARKINALKPITPVIEAFGEGGRYWSTTLKYAALFDSEPSQAQWIWSLEFLVGFAVGCGKSRENLGSQFGNPKNIKILAEHQGHLRKYFYLGTDILELSSWKDDHKRIDKIYEESLQRFIYFRARGSKNDRVVEMYEELKTFIKRKCKGLEEEER